MDNDNKTYIWWLIIAILAVIILICLIVIYTMKGGMIIPTTFVPSRIPPTNNNTQETYKDDRSSMDHRYKPTGTKRYNPYEYMEGGPSVGELVGVPVPKGAMKETNERYTGILRSRYYPPNNVFPDIVNIPPTMIDPYSNYSNQRVRYSPYDIPFDNKGKAKSIPPLDYNKPYVSVRDPRGGIALAPGGTFINEGPTFYGSLDAYAPFPEINTPFEKVGLLANNNNQVLELFRKPIAPINDVWQYSTQDKNGFINILDEKYLETGDTVHHIFGKEGPWKVKMYVNNKYVWM